MIRATKLRKFFLTKCDTIINSIDQFCNTGDHEEIHKLRVEFKKIRALISLVKECDKNSPVPRELKTAKIVYRRAGVVRDAFIAHIMRLRHSSSTDKSFLDHSAEEFCKRKDLHLLVISEWRDNVKEKFADIGNDCVTEYYAKWLSKLNESFANLEEDDLHEDRKIIKRLMYLYPLMNSQVRILLKLNVQYLDSLQEEIGKWHDTLVTREHYSGSEKKNSRHIKKLERETEARLKSIRLLTKNFPVKYNTFIAG